MIHVKNVLNIDGKKEDLSIPSNRSRIIDAKGKLTWLPGVIDAHVHARVPGGEHKEDWRTFAKAAIAGGVTTVFDMPNNIPPCLSIASLEEKMKLIDQQLKEVNIGLRYHLYMGSDEHHLEQILEAKGRCIGIKLFMGGSTGHLCMENEKDLETAFKNAAKSDLLVAVHAEDHTLIKVNEAKYKGNSDPATHSQIRDLNVAAAAVKKAIALAEKYNNRLYILHVSTKKELDIIRQAKQRKIQVYAEATPHHLFLNDTAYSIHNTKVQVNPPIRSEKDRLALWDGVADGTIDSIGTDHAPHTLDEKSLPYPRSPAGLPGVETLLPLLLNASKAGLISLPKIVELLRSNVERIFKLEPNHDIVLVDLNLKQTVDEKRLKSKCGWTPFHGSTLTGWPVYTIIRGEVYEAL